MRDMCRIEKLLTGYGVDVLTTQSIIGELNAFPRLNVISSNVRIIDNTAVALIVLKGSLDGKRIQRTLYGGMDVFTQLMQRWSIPTSIIGEIRSLVQEEINELEGKVRKAIFSLTSNEKLINEVKDEFRVRSKKEAQVKRVNLVTTMVGLFNEGWTRESILSCLDEAVCINVLSS